jgi:hypothetical protein
MEISFTPLIDSSFPKIMELGCSDVPGSEFGCTVDPGVDLVLVLDFYPLLGVYQLEVGLDLLIWRI